MKKRMETNAHIRNISVSLATISQLFNSAYVIGLERSNFEVMLPLSVFK